MNKFCSIVSWPEFTKARTAISEITNDPPMATQASVPEIDFGSARPKKALTRKPTNGSRKISASMFTT